MSILPAQPGKIVGKEGCLSSWSQRNSDFVHLYTRRFPGTGLPGFDSSLGMGSTLPLGHRATVNGHIGKGLQKSSGLFPLLLSPVAGMLGRPLK